jgi:uncharacterized alpha-E superfamily protein
MPRSLIACYDNIVRFLDALGKDEETPGKAQQQAHDIMKRLEQATTKDIFKIGLHEFITAFVEDNSLLGQTISEQYLLV